MTEVDSWVNGYELHRTDEANHDYVMSIKNIYYVKIWVLAKSNESI